MVQFIIGTLALLAFLAWGTWRTAQFLKQEPVTFNLLLLPAENVLRVILIFVCIALARVSAQPDRQFGWVLSSPFASIVIGAVTGFGVAMFLPRVTEWAVKRFGVSVYSPVVLQSIMPRNRREWFWVPLALLPAVLLEELLFRALLLGGFALFAPPIFLGIVWSIAFGAMHLPQGALGIGVAAALGLLLSILFLATGDLLAPFVAHYLINVMQLVFASRDKTLLESYDSGSHF